MLDRIQHEIFCHEVLKSPFSATQAAIRAGYSRKSAHTLAKDLMAREDIRARIDELKTERLNQLKTEAADVVRALMAAVQADVNEIVQVQQKPCGMCWDDDTDYPNPDCRVCEGQGHARVIVQDTRMLSEGARLLYAGAKAGRDGIEVKVHDRAKFIEMLARHFSLFNDKSEVTVVGDIGKRLIASRKVTKT